MISPLLKLSADDAAHMLSGGLLAVNVRQMQLAGPGRPKVCGLIRSKRIRYSAEDPEEEWKGYNNTLDEIRQNGVAVLDCEDIATLVAAELVADGIDVDARPVVYNSGTGIFHVVTNSPKYGLLDACILAGMGGEAS